MPHWLSDAEMAFARSHLTPPLSVHLCLYWLNIYLCHPCPNSREGQGEGARGSPSHCPADVGRKTRPDILRMPNRNLMLSHSLPQCLFDYNRRMSTLATLLFTASSVSPHRAHFSSDLLQIKDPCQFLRWKNKRVPVDTARHNWCDSIFTSWKNKKSIPVRFNLMASQFESSSLNFVQ